MLLSSPELSSPGCADKLLEKGSGDDEFSGRGRAGACPEELHRVTGGNLQRFSGAAEQICLPT
jgi:hypothetical protein